MFRHIGLAALLMLLIGFPAELFNKTVEENYDELARWFSRPNRRTRRKWHATITLPLFAAAAALLYALLDPGITDDRSTLALVIGLFTGVLATTLAFELSAAALVRSRPGGRATLRVFPKALAFAAVCVAVSRLADFRPGYVYGLIAGYVFARRPSGLSKATGLSAADAGRSVAVGAASLLAVSVWAWAAWAPLDHTLDTSDTAPSLAVLLPDAALAAMFVMGLEGLAFGLVPVRILDGGVLARWSRLAWIALWGAAMFGFVHVLLDPDTGRVNKDNDDAVLSVIVLFLAFGTASVSLWAYFRFRRSSPRSGAPPAAP